MGQHANIAEMDNETLVATVQDLHSEIVARPGLEGRLGRTPDGGRAPGRRAVHGRGPQHVHDQPEPLARGQLRVRGRGGVVDHGHLRGGRELTR